MTKKLRLHDGDFESPACSLKLWGYPPGSRILPLDMTAQILIVFEI